MEERRVQVQVYTYLYCTTFKLKLELILDGFNLLMQNIVNNNSKASPHKFES